MHTNVRFKLVICVLLLSVLEICVADKQRASLPTICSTLGPVKLDTWWRVYVKDYTNRSGSRTIEEPGDVSLHVNRSLNYSTVNFAEDGRNDGDVESDLKWKVARQISDEVVKGRVPPDKGPADGREVNDDEAADEGKAAKQKHGTNIGYHVLESPELNLAHRMMSVLPPFVPSSSTRVTTAQCIKDSQFYLQELRDLAIWALKMHDASAKLPPGLLNGNVNQYGDIDQCLQVRSPRQGGVIKGRYCLTTMALRLSDPHHPLLGHIQQLLQSHEMVRSELDDPGHRVPRYSAIHWALCVPASCNASDVQVALSDTLHRHTEGTGIGFKVRVADDMCQTEDDRLYLPNSTIIVG